MAAVVEEPEHGGRFLRDLRERAGMAVAEVAARAGITVADLEEIERSGTHDLSHVTTLVRCTQPPRPSWRDEGHEHDLSLARAHRPPKNAAEWRYWARIERVRAAIKLNRSTHPAPDR